MSTLHETLTDFGRAIVLGTKPASLIEKHYAAYDSAVALDIYRNNYRGNLHDALAAAYPVTLRLVGDDFFRYMAQHYISRYPSRSGNLHHYGAELAEFVSVFEPAQALVYLADVVTLEWNCHCAYFADDTVVLNTEALARIPPPRYSDLILHLHPACYLLHSPYPVAAIWQAHQSGADENFHINLDSGPSNALVSRREGIVSVVEMTPADATWLQAIMAGVPLGEATATALAEHTRFDLQTALLHLVTQGALSDFSLRENP
jgi:hypothetical protein